MVSHPKRSNITKMKRQRNTQQVKEQEKCPPNQTKEEEIGNLPEKEFQIMIVKMIQNLEIKMESHINSLETRIEMMQERFNKDLEEIKKSQYIMNNAINEIKNTLEGPTVPRNMPTTPAVTPLLPEACLGVCSRLPHSGIWTPLYNLSKGRRTPISPPERQLGHR